ncbi:hypothetical protein AVEN_250708-1 [Araneus ventricosus]|uniref:Uncharacterized protein n=1 Tax=Araneus ventricosus TaxID=182803 RepID=A0A4Y2VXK8_ARAVE|nr:hypothetical protein AVEN_250708-1 [Araneus ventricosus]
MQVLWLGREVYKGHAEVTLSESYGTDGLWRQIACWRKLAPFGQIDYYENATLFRYFLKWAEIQVFRKFYVTSRLSKYIRPGLDHGVSLIETGYFTLKLNVLGVLSSRCEANPAGELS